MVRPSSSSYTALSNTSPVGASSTVTLHAAVFPLYVRTRMVAVPVLLAVTRPFVTKATFALLVLQLTEPTPFVSFASSCSVSPTLSFALPLFSFTAVGAATTSTSISRVTPFSVRTATFVFPVLTPFTRMPDTAATLAFPAVR